MHFHVPWDRNRNARANPLSLSKRKTNPERDREFLERGRKVKFAVLSNKQALSQVEIACQKPNPDPCADPSFYSRKTRSQGKNEFHAFYLASLSIWKRANMPSWLRKRASNPSFPSSTRISNQSGFLCHQLQLRESIDQFWRVKRNRMNRCRPCQWLSTTYELRPLCELTCASLPARADVRLALLFFSGIFQKFLI